MISTFSEPFIDKSDEILKTISISEEVNKSFECVGSSTIVHSHFLRYD